MQVQVHIGESGWARTTNAHTRLVPEFRGVERTLIRQDDLGDGRAVRARADPQQLLRAAKRIRHHARRLRRALRRRHPLRLRHNEPAADRIKHLARKHRPHCHKPRTASRSDATPPPRRDTSDRAETADRLRSLNAIPTRPPSFSRPVARTSAIFSSTVAGSTVSGASPISPSSTARSVPCPIPVSASEPYRSTVTRTALAQALPPPQLAHKPQRRPHRPHRCELDGPIPILNSSNRLVFTPHCRRVIA